MRRFAGLALALVATPSMACDLTAALFMCGAPEGKEGGLSLCGPKHIEVGPNDPVQFIDDSEGGTGAIYPVEPGSIQNFAFAHWWTDRGSYRMEVSWADAGKHFRLFHEVQDD